SAYDAFTDAQKSLLSDIDKFERMEERLAHSHLASTTLFRASQVVELIESLPSVDELTLSDREQVESARSAYDALTDSQKSLVSSTEERRVGKERIAQLAQETSDQEAASQVVELIESIPSVDELTL